MIPLKQLDSSLADCIRYTSYILFMTHDYIIPYLFAARFTHAPHNCSFQLSTMVHCICIVMCQLNIFETIFHDPPSLNAHQPTLMAHSSEAALERHDAEEERDGRLAEENAELEAALKVETGLEGSRQI